MKSAAAAAPELLLDSNIITGGLVSRWGQARAILSLCAARTCRLVLADYVRIEVERNLLKHFDKTAEAQAEQLLMDYEKLIRLTRPKIVPLPHPEDVLKNRHLIRHAADVPVVLSAINCRPDWIITDNRDHFTDEVAAKIGIKVASPAEFFNRLVEAFEG